MRKLCSSFFTIRALLWKVKHSMKKQVFSVMAWNFMSTSILDKLQRNRVGTILITKVCITYVLLNEINLQHYSRFYRAKEMGFQLPYSPTSLALHNPLNVILLLSTVEAVDFVLSSPKQSKTPTWMDESQVLFSQDTWASTSIAPIERWGRWGM